MTHEEKHELLDLTIQRTSQGLMGWYQLNQELRCKAAGVTFSLQTTKAGESWMWEGKLVLYLDDEVIIFAENSTSEHKVRQLYNAADVFAKTEASKRLRDVIKNLRITEPAATSVLEISREA